MGSLEFSENESEKKVSYKLVLVQGESIKIEPPSVDEAVTIYHWKALPCHQAGEEVSRN
jgi:hypothetical protein